MKKYIILAFLFGFLSPAEAFWGTRLSEGQKEECRREAARYKNEFSAKQAYKTCIKWEKETVKEEQKKKNKYYSSLNHPEKCKQKYFDHKRKSMNIYGKNLYDLDSRSEFNMWLDELSRYELMQVRALGREIKALNRKDCKNYLIAEYELGNIQKINKIKPIKNQIVKQVPQAVEPTELDNYVTDILESIPQTSDLAMFEDELKILDEKLNQSVDQGQEVTTPLFEYEKNNSIFNMWLDELSTYDFDKYVLRKETIIEESAKEEENTKVIKTKFSTIDDAILAAVGKTNLSCVNNTDRALSKEQTQNFLNNMGLIEADLNDPLAELLYLEFKTFISEDCRSFAEGREEATEKLLKNHDIEWGDNESKIPMNEFAKAVGIMSATQCVADKGLFKTQKEFLEANALAFEEEGIPLRYAQNPLLLKAAIEIKNLWNDTCSDFAGNDEKAGEIIMKFFEQQYEKNTKVIKTKFSNMAAATSAMGTKLSFDCLSKSGKVLDKNTRKRMLKESDLT